MMYRMNKQEATLSQFGKTVSNLREVLTKLEGEKENRAVFRDSAIQRFEIAFDICWKTLKTKLQNDYGIATASPKKCFQESFKQGIIDNDTIWLDMTDMRNETTHTYNEALAESVLARLPQACSALEKLLWKLRQ